MTTDVRREDGQFAKKVDDDAVLREVAYADRALATNEVADRLDLPRTTARDALERLRHEGYMESDLAHGTTRLWWVPGNWGDTSIVDVYPSEEFATYLETGEFSAETEFQTIAGMLEEALIELNWAMSIDGGYDLDEMMRIADLFDMGFEEWVTHSPGDIYNLIHEGAIHDIPTADNDRAHEAELPTGPEFRETRNEAEVLQKSVSEAAGINQSMVSKWERGRKDLRPESIRELQNALAELR